MSRERELLLKIEPFLKLLVVANMRRSLVDPILAMELGLKEALTLEERPEPEQPPLQHLHD